MENGAVTQVPLRPLIAEWDREADVLVFRIAGTLLAQENLKDKKILIRNEINSHFIRYFGGTYTVSAEADEGPTVIFTCPLSAPGN